MLFPHQTLNDHFIVIDHDRKRVPLSLEDVIVPVYPNKGDMVTVRGDGDELWLAHIQAVSKEAKTSNVYFYMPVEGNNNKYHKEVGGWLEKVHWDSITGISSGRYYGSAAISTAGNQYSSIVNFILVPHVLHSFTMKSPFGNTGLCKYNSKHKIHAWLLLKLSGYNYSASPGFNVAIQLYRNM